MSADSGATGPERWATVLDELERRIVAQETVLELAGRGCQPEPEDLLARVSFAAPNGLPPMPAELAARAQALLERTHIVQDGVANLIETTRPGRAARRPRAARWRAATNLDVRA